MTTKLYLMQEFAEYLKANPIECIKFFQDANILDSNGNLLPQYKKSSDSNMDESRKSFSTMTSDELRKAAIFCAAAHTTDSPLANISKYLNTCADALEKGPVAWRITDGEGGYYYRDDPLEDWQVAWIARWGRKHDPLYTQPQPPSAQADAVEALWMIIEAANGRQRHNQITDEMHAALRYARAVLAAQVGKDAE